MHSHLPIANCKYTLTANSATQIKDNINAAWLIWLGRRHATPCRAVLPLKVPFAIPWSTSCSPADAVPAHQCLRYGMLLFELNKCQLHGEIMSESKPLAPFCQFARRQCSQNSKY